MNNPLVIPMTVSESTTSFDMSMDMAINVSGDIDIRPLSVTENGVYREDGKAYTPVTVNVPQPSGTKQISITQNGTTTEDVEWYEDTSISVSVPNTYTASDEGKVVSSGALVSQTSRTVSDNGTYDTTTNNQIVVNNEDYVESLVAFGVTEDLADGIEAMTTYSNEVTGASDTTLSEAVATLANGYGQGGGLLSVIDTITATENTRSLNIDYTEYSAYDIVIVAQDIELTSSDWLYYNLNTTEHSGGSYNNGSRVKHTGVAVWKLPLGGSSRNIVGVVSNMTFTETSNNINNVIIYTYTATKLIKAGSTLTVYGGNLNG